jgi:hypothetical protein
MGDEPGFRRGSPPLYNLVYCSRAAPGVDEAAVAAIIASARRHNPSHFITGLLFFAGGVFLQWLEGPRMSILGLMRVIEADPRHSDLVTLSQSEEERERVFGDWDMELVAPADIREVLLDALGTVSEPKSAEALQVMLQQLDQGPLRTLVGA